MTIVIPSVENDLAPDILNPLLANTGLFRDSEIASVTTSSIGASFAATAYHVTLETTSPSASPVSLVAKLPSVHKATRDLNFGDDGAYRLEALFYNEFAVLSGIPCPEIYLCHFQDDPPEFCILMEDLTSWESGSFNTGADRQQTEAIALELAALHARYWNDESLRDHKALWPQDSQHMGPYPKGLAVAEELGDALLPNGVLPIAKKYEKHRLAVFLDRQSRPFTLTHGDSHVQNMMFRRRPDHSLDLKILDYGRLIAGKAAVDLAYLLEYSLVVDDRRRWERDILSLYHERLVTLGVDDYTYDELIDDYRLGLFQGLMPVLSVVSRYGPDEALAIGGGMAKTAADRLVALVDWDCGQLLA